MKCQITQNFVQQNSDFEEGKSPSRNDKTGQNEITERDIIKVRSIVAILNCHILAYFWYKIVSMYTHFFHLLSNVYFFVFYFLAGYSEQSVPSVIKDSVKTILL